MTLNPTTRERFRRLAVLLDRVPDDVWVEADEEGLAFQGNNQETVQARRALFPGVFWTKSYNEGCAWWEYRGVFEGVPVRVYACPQPPTCRAVVTETTAEEDVPIAFEKRQVTRKHVRWECGQPSTVEQDAVPV